MSTRIGRHKKGGKGTTRPYVGTNTYGRRSTVVSRHLKWKAHLEQSNQHAESQERFEDKEKWEEEKKQLSKQGHKRAAQNLQEHYHADGISEPEVQRALPDWKKEKIFINAAFPSNADIAMVQGQRVYKNKKIMQQYLHRMVDETEWATNIELLAQLRELYYSKNASESQVAKSSQE